MTTVINITQDESEAVEILYNRFTGYCNMLGYLAQYGSINTNLFDKKWNEAVEINKDLESLKVQLDNKYRPNNITNANYTFDFINHQMVYTYD